MTSQPERPRRAAGVTQERVVAAALEHVHAHGVASVTINGLARDLGVSGPALYKHVAGLPELLDLVVAHLYDEATDVLLAAANPLPEQLQIFAMSRALRRWALSKPREFGACFTAPVDPLGRAAGGAAGRAGQRFGATFAGAFAAALAGRTPPGPPAPLDPATERDLARYREVTGTGLTNEQLAYFLECWARIYGHITLEALGQLAFALADAGPLFEACLRRIGHDLGLDPGRP